MKNCDPFRPAWVEIHVNNLIHNLQVIRAKIRPGVKILAVVKSNAYGHGAGPIVKASLKHGVDLLGVATVGEGIALRQEGVASPILVLGAADQQEAELVVEYSLTPTIFSLDFAEALQAASWRRHCLIPFHIRVDTSNGTMGIAPELVKKFIADVRNLSALQLAGVYTHLYASYENSDSLFHKQIELFNITVSTIKKVVKQPLLIHAASSPAIWHWPEANYDMVRVGNLLYGLSPELGIGSVAEHIYDDSYSSELKPVMQLKARVVDIKKITAGQLTIYGQDQNICRETIAAIIPVGYADGFPLSYLSHVNVLIRGKKVKVLGRVVMDYFLADVTDLPEICVGDEVVIWGEQAGQRKTIDEIVKEVRENFPLRDAATGQSIWISRASFCLLSDRLPRKYVYDAEDVVSAGSDVT